MAGHSHWAGIKHKKGKADKQKSKIFSKLSREITVAAKLGDKDPEMNARLRSAIQSARTANMPKENIERAIDKSEINANSNFENIRYEGFGPEKINVIVETLTEMLESGYVKTYQDIRQKQLDKLPMEKCPTCDGNGVRDDDVIKGECNGCDGTGKVEPWSKSYPFEVENVEKFVEFVKDSGGFQIF